MTSDGSLKVLDFGTARLVDHPRSTPTGDAMGTAEFVAPEQARGAAKDAEPRADIYSVGAVLFSLLTGRFVHSAKNPMERLVLAATKPAPSLLSILPDAHHDLAHAIDMALAFRREQRFPDARTMRAALDRAAGSIGSSRGNR